MSMRAAFVGVGLGAGVLLVLCGSAMGAPRDAEARRAMTELLNEHPEVRVTKFAGRIDTIYGAPMATADTAANAAALWLEEHVQALGAGVPELLPRRTDTLPMTDATVLVYDQVMDGLPVDQSAVRIVVKNNAGLSEVALVNARLAERPAGGFPPITTGGAQAVDSVATQPLYAGLQDWSAPEMVIYFGESDGEAPVSATRVWKFTGHSQGPMGPSGFTFFVDAATGSLIHARNEIVNADVTGIVRGNASPGVYPDQASNPAVPAAMPDIRVTSSVSGATFASIAGAYVSTGNPVASVNMSTTVTGRWAAVNNSAGAEITAAGSVAAPGVLDLLLNATPSQATTAQVNAYLHTHITHNHFKSRAPSFTALDIVLPVNVMVASTCNANFDPISIQTNFFNAGGGCVNTAYSSVVAHEYGHFIVNRLGLAQGAFGEGFGDTMSLMIYDDPILGRNFRETEGSFVRNPLAANQQYPCSSSAVHTCGQILGGTWWGIRTRFGQAYGEPTGLELARQLHVDWALMTAGGQGLNSAHPTTAVEVLTVDDNDANLSNGTPNYGLICPSFLEHGISCPAVSLIDFQYPFGRPSIVAPTGGTQLIVDAVNIGASAVSGTGVLWVSINDGSFSSYAMTDNGAGRFTGTFPAAPCGAFVEYYVQVGTTTSGNVTSPFDAPISGFSAISATGITTLVHDTVETNTGWTMGVAGDTASTGQWTRVNPVGTIAQPENDQTEDPGAFCFVTGQGSVGGAAGDADVDGGFTTLVTPVLNLSGATNASLSYYRWYNNSAGGAPNADTFVVDITNNGTTWVNVEVVGPSGPGTAGGWIRKQINVADFVPPTANVRLRFIASDTATASLVEAAVDELMIENIECAPAFCPGDADGNGTVNFADITAVLGNFGLAGPVGDADNNGSVNFADITAVLANFGVPCP